MAPENQHSEPAQEKSRNFTPELREEQTDCNPLQEMQSRLLKADECLRNAEKNNDEIVFKASKESSVQLAKRNNEHALITATYNDTIGILNKKIHNAQAMLAQDKEDHASPTWGKRFDSAFKFGGLLGTTTMESEAKGISLQEAALQKLQQLKSVCEQKFSGPTINLYDLKQFRNQLGLPDLPRGAVTDYDEHQAMAQKGLEAKDVELEVDWMALNAELKSAEFALDAWETALNGIDTGMGIAAGFVPGGSEVYELSRALTAVSVGSKTPEQAAKEFAFGVIAGRVGGKAMSKLPIDKIATAAGKKLAPLFTGKGAQKIAAALGELLQSGGKGALQGAISGGTEGTLHAGADVMEGKQTLQQAAGSAWNSAVLGALFGGGLGAGGKGFEQIRKAWKNKSIPVDQASIMAIPDTPEGYALRVAAGAKALGMDIDAFSEGQVMAILRAHDVPRTGIGADGNPTYSMADLRQKVDMLKGGGFTMEQSDTLLRMGVCGSIPPPPPPIRPKASPSPSIEQSIPKVTELLKNIGSSLLDPQSTKNLRDDILSNQPDGFKAKRDYMIRLLNDQRRNATSDQLQQIDAEVARLESLKFNLIQDALRREGWDTAEGMKLDESKRHSLLEVGITEAPVGFVTTGELQKSQPTTKINRTSANLSRAPLSASESKEAFLHFQLLDRIQNGVSYTDIREQLNNIRYLDLLNQKPSFDAETARAKDIAKRLYPNEIQLKFNSEDDANSYVFSQMNDPQLKGQIMNQSVKDRKHGGYQLEYGKNVEINDPITTFYFNPRNARLGDAIRNLDECLDGCNAQIKTSVDNLFGQDNEKVVVYFSTSDTESINRFISNISAKKEQLDATLNPFDFKGMIKSFKIPLSPLVCFVERPTGESWDAHLVNIFTAQANSVLGQVLRGDISEQAMTFLFKGIRENRNKKIPGLAAN